STLSKEVPKDILLKIFFFYFRLANSLDDLEVLLLVCKAWQQLMQPQLQLKRFKAIKAGSPTNLTHQMLPLYLAILRSTQAEKQRFITSATLLVTYLKAALSPLTSSNIDVTIEIVLSQKQDPEKRVLAGEEKQNFITMANLFLICCQAQIPPS